MLFSFHKLCKTDWSGLRRAFPIDINRAIQVEDPQGLGGGHFIFHSFLSLKADREKHKCDWFQRRCPITSKQGVETLLLIDSIQGKHLFLNSRG